MNVIDENSLDSILENQIPEYEGDVKKENQKQKAGVQVLNRSDLQKTGEIHPVFLLKLFFLQIQELKVRCKSHRPYSYL